MLPLRLLLLFAILYIVILVLKSRNAGKKGKSDAAKIGEEMVLDPQCQTYLPKSEALARQGKYFCSEECARRYLAG